MTYPVLGRTIKIYSIVAVKSEIPNVYEIEGDHTLTQIGLAQKCWLQLPDHFCTGYPETAEDFTSQPKFLSQRVLAGHLREAIA